jgi:hypothetical protein
VRSVEVELTVFEKLIDVTFVQDEKLTDAYVPVSTDGAILESAKAGVTKMRLAINNETNK